MIRRINDPENPGIVKATEARIPTTNKRINIHQFVNKFVKYSLTENLQDNEVPYTLHSNLLIINFRHI